jgi:hypothetical protein
MNVIRKAVSALGGIFLAALLIAALAPKATRGIAAALVQVTNTTANPVPTLDANSPAYQPASLQISLVEAASTSITAPSTLPSGGAYRELVINWVTGACFGDLASSLPAPFTISLQTDGSQLSFFPATSSSGPATYFGTATSLYASPGSTIGLVALNGTGIQIQSGANESVTTRGASASCLVNADGYYVTQ